MAVYTHVSAEALTAFLTRYDVGELTSAKGIAEGVENSNYMIDTTAGRYFLTLYEKRVNAGDLPFFLAMLDHLADRDCPVPCAIRDRDGQAVQQLADRPACLIEFLPGVSVSHPTPAQARAVGEAMGAMHTALADFALDRPNSMGVGEWRPLYDRCGHDLESIAAGLFAAAGDALTVIEAAWPRGLATAAIHADLFPDNVLMRGDRVTGLIDFYFACTDIRAYDLAVAITAWAFDAGGERADPAIAQAMIAGYAATFDLSEAERRALPLLARGACMRFFLSRAWDWLHTPADALVTRKDPRAYWRRLQWLSVEANCRALIG